MVHLTECNMADNFNALLPSIKWSVEADLFLQDFVHRCTLPHLALVTKGQHLEIGAPNLANPNLKPYVFVHARQDIRKVLGQLVKWKDNGKHNSLTELRVAIPETFDGFFEILSEDGKPLKCLESVKELGLKFPDSCLVRQSCKAYLPESNGELRNLNKTRVIEEGEILTLCGQFAFKRTSFLRCFDESGQSVYLKMSHKGKFSPIAKKDAITGVHTMQNILGTKRLPLTVKMVKGGFPEEVCSKSSGPLVLRLQHVFQEQIALFFTLQKDSQCYAVPLNAFLKLAPMLNYSSVAAQKEFKQLCQQSENILPAFLNRVTPYYEPQHTSLPHEIATPLPDDVAIAVSTRKIHKPNDEVPSAHAVSDTCSNNDIVQSQQVTDEEIEQLYDYIRGLAPLPDSCRQVSRAKPAPPPLETLPTRRSPSESSRTHQPPPDKIMSPEQIQKHSGGGVNDTSSLNRCRRSQSSVSPKSRPESRLSRQFEAINAGQTQVYQSLQRAAGNKSVSQSSERLLASSPQPASVTVSKVPDIVTDHQPPSFRLRKPRPISTRVEDDVLGPLSPSMRREHRSNERIRKPRPFSMVIPENIAVVSPVTINDYYASYLHAPQHSVYNNRSYLNLNMEGKLNTHHSYPSPIVQPRSYYCAPAPEFEHRPQSKYYIPQPAYVRRYV